MRQRDAERLPQTHGRIALALGILTLAGSFPAMLCGRVSELYLYGLSPYYALLLGLFIGVAMQSATLMPSPRRAAWSRRSLLFTMLVVIGWLACGTHEKVSLALNVSARAEQFFDTTDAWLASVCRPGERVALYWRDADKADTLSYSAYVWDDRALFRGVVRFAERAQSKNVDYSERGRSGAPNEYVAFSDASGLHIMEAPNPVLKY